jgi:hypothetical protein
MSVELAEERQVVNNFADCGYSGAFLAHVFAASENGNSTITRAEDIFAGRHRHGIR